MRSQRLLIFPVEKKKIKFPIKINVYFNFFFAYHKIFPLLCVCVKRKVGVGGAENFEGEGATE